MTDATVDQAPASPAQPADPVRAVDNVNENFAPQGSGISAEEQSIKDERRNEILRQLDEAREEMLEVKAEISRLLKLLREMGDSEMPE